MAHLTASLGRGFDVVIVDNLSRREIDLELEVESLTPIRPIGERIRVWKELTGKEIGFVNLDLAEEYDRFESLLRDERPDAIVHFGEQRAAPVLDAQRRRPSATRWTTTCAGRTTCWRRSSRAGWTSRWCTSARWASTATAGPARRRSPRATSRCKVPTPDGDIDREILHPANPGSVYHLTKTLDQLLFAFYAVNDQLRITDLHQGIVWGTQTPQTVAATSG